MLPLFSFFAKVRTRTTVKAESETARTMYCLQNIRSRKEHIFVL